MSERKDRQDFLYLQLYVIIKTFSAIIFLIFD
jgi:hypothetical protein